MQQINFTGNLEGGGDENTMFFIIEESKETFFLDFLQVTVKVL